MSTTIMRNNCHHRANTATTIIPVTECTIIFSSSRNHHSSHFATGAGNGDFPTSVIVPSRLSSGTSHRGCGRGRRCWRCRRVVPEVWRQVCFERPVAVCLGPAGGAGSGPLRSSQLEHRRIRSARWRDHYELASGQYFERCYRVGRSEFRNKLSCENHRDKLYNRRSQRAVLYEPCIRVQCLTLLKISAANLSFWKRPILWQYGAT